MSLHFRSEILSFYKEELNHETNNYVNQYARAYNKSIPDAFQCIANDAIAYSNEVRRLLGDGPERDAWDAYMLGYIQFHIYCPRYRLEEVLPELFQ
ncbi:terpenoid synthase [Panus rudis PR-1116 ss-1]|nr:terpenoid synthase [Panus rudis PR-1116 ss-1]